MQLFYKIFLLFLQISCILCNFQSEQNKSAPQKQEIQTSSQIQKQNVQQIKQNKIQDTQSQNTNSKIIDESYSLNHIQPQEAQEQNNMENLNQNNIQSNNQHVNQQKILQDQNHMQTPGQNSIKIQNKIEAKQSATPDFQNKANIKMQLDQLNTQKEKPKIIFQSKLKKEQDAELQVKDNSLTNFTDKSKILNVTNPENIQIQNDQNNNLKQDPQQVKDCEFMNVFFTLGNIFHTSEHIGDSQLKLSFISPQKCKTTPGMIIKTNDNKQYVFKFSLIDIYVTRIFPQNEEEKYKYYIRYVYMAYIKGIGEIEEFKYDLVKNIQKQNEVSRSFQYKSRVLQANKTGNLKFITYGDQTYDDKGKFLTQEVSQQDYDMLILLGDLGYELQYNYGKQGDEYFEMLEKVSSMKPVQFINGNHDMEDLGRILNFRVLQPGCINKDQNNFYTFELANIYFYFYNTDFYKNYTADIIFDRMNHISKEHNLDKNKNKMRFLFTHRSLNCFNYKNGEGCYAYSDMFYRQYWKYLKNANIDIHFAAHIHMYQRFEVKKIQKFLKSGANREGQSIGMLNIINGAGGHVEDLPDFVTEKYENVEGLEYLPNQLGYVLVEVQNFNKVISKYHSIIDKYNKKDDKCKVLDSVEYFRGKRKLLLTK